MQATRIISATQARNNFFNLLDSVYYDQQTVVVQKNKTPRVAIFPFTEWVKLGNQLTKFSTHDSLFSLAGKGSSQTKNGYSSDKYQLFTRL